MTARDMTCCFTGHRPAKLPWGQREEDSRCLALKAELARRLENAYRRGYRHFICGMAQGCDHYFGEAVLTLGERYPDLRLEAAIPCRTQAQRWTAEQKARYEAILNRCHWETLVQSDYDPGCMMRRNRYMVDNSSLVLSIFDGTSGGTMKTLAYAMGEKIETDIIDLTDYT